MLQNKPGVFTLDECGGCAHVFQNPRLTVEGLDFYYGDFYDGVGEEEMELLGATGYDQYAARAAFVAEHAEPTRWLDVGGGHGHFSLVARGVWPKARFDVVDLAESVEVAAERGWVDDAHRELFPALAPRVAGEYDVVSMHHYLEHTRDPGAELDAAAVALEPGGLLSIEMPDPTSWLARRMGRWWGPVPAAPAPPHDPDGQPRGDAGGTGVHGDRPPLARGAPGLRLRLRGVHDRQPPRPARRRALAPAPDALDAAAPQRGVRPGHAGDRARAGRSTT